MEGGRGRSFERRSHWWRGTAGGIEAKQAMDVCLAFVPSQLVLVEVRGLRKSRKQHCK
jgi:hypothetical protein